MESFFETLPIALWITFALLAIWFFFSLYYILIRARRNPDKINPYIFESIPPIFTTIGILGTFIGIAVGLWNFKVKDIEDSIPELLQGLRTAFLASIFGIGLMIIFSKLTAYRQWKDEKGKLSDETKALNTLIGLITELKKEFGDNFIYIDENNNKVKPANVFRGIYEESQKQAQALQSFSTDLANKVEAGFEKIINTPDHGVVAELKSVIEAIEKLGQKLQDPATDMTQKIVDELKMTLGGMIDKFQVSIGDSTNKELGNIAKLLSEAGEALTGFPIKLKDMMDNLNENFKGLQSDVEQISKQTLIQSVQSTEQMTNQVKAMSEILGGKFGELQNVQEGLMKKQSENYQISDNLLKAFNLSIERMTFLSKGITESISKFDEVKTGLNSTTNQLKLITDNVIKASNSFKDAQIGFSQHSNDFLKNNSETIREIQNSLSRAKEVSADYSNNFGIIEKGLKSIFEQIQNGLDDYQKSVKTSLQTYLGEYTKAHTNSVESLVSAMSKQEDILQELNEQITKLTGKKS